MLGTFETNRKDQSCHVASKERFPQTMKQYVEEENIWRMRFYEEQEQREERLTEEYLKQTGISGIEWEQTRDNTVFVHNELSRNEVLEFYTRLLSYENKREDDLREFKARELLDNDDKIEVFSSLIKDLPPERRPEIGKEKPQQGVKPGVAVTVSGVPGLGYPSYPVW